MTKRQQKKLQRYIDRLRPMLGLADWEVFVRPDPTEEGHLATIYPIWGCRAANLRFDSDFCEKDPAYQRETCVHELLHCVHAQTQHQVEFVLPNHMEAGAELFGAMYEQANEYAIDGLAVAIAPLFPLPELA